MARILVVDDEKGIRDSVAGALKRLGHEALVAANVADALSIVQETRPNLIISDVCMEGQDGLAFLSTIRNNPNTAAIPFVIITGQPDTAGMLSGIENAADGYIPKPFSLETLSKAVRSRLGREEVLRRDADEIKAQLYRVLQASPDLIALADSESLNFFFLNSLGRTILETGDEIHRPLSSFFTTTCSENFNRHALPTALKTGQWVGETVLVSTSGRRVPVELVLQSHRRHDGKVEYISVIARDLTERKEGERALRSSEFRFRCLVDALPDALVIYDGTGRINFCNARAVELLGYSSQELLRLSARDLFRDSLPNEPHTETAFIRHGPTAVERQVFQKNGEPVPVSVFLEHLEVEGEQLELCIIHDLTDRKRIERERQEFEVQLRQAHKLESIGQLAAGIAHEINTPTQYIGDNTRFLKDAFGDLFHLLKDYQDLAKSVSANTTANRELKAINDTVERVDLDYLLKEIPNAIGQSLEGIERVSKIVRAMKDFSHPNLSLEKSHIDINQAIESTLTVARNEWKYVANVETDFDKSLPSVPCLPGEFNQVILNLVVNAAHAIGDVVQGTEEKGTIRISTSMIDTSVEIRISDTGTGIPEAVQKRIFEPFFTTKEVGKGTGQGLAIARSVIVDKHSGSIHFQTESGKGTTFIIRIPLNNLQ
jgi:two-component system, NtrC family, sensor kinase